MELAKQVCSLGLAKRLFDLGVRQDSYLYWKTDEGETLPGRGQLSLHVQQGPNSRFRVHGR